MQFNMQVDEVHRFIDRTERYVRQVQPSIIREVLKGRENPETLYQYARDLGESRLDDAALGSLHQVDARRLQRSLFAILSAAERFELGSGREPGEATRALQWAERMIVGCATRAAHPVFPTPYSHWIENSQQAIHFESNMLGSPERTFGDLVRETDCTYETAGILLLEVLDALDQGRLLEAAEILRAAARLIMELRSKYQAWMVGSDPSLWSFTPLDFNLMRQWLVPLKIDGEIRTPANAAHLTSTTSVDCGFGTASDWYAELIRQRRVLVPFEHVRRIDADLALVEAKMTVLDRCAKLLGLGDARHASTAAPLAGRLIGDLYEFAAAVREFGHAWASLSGTHFGQIRKYLEKFEPFVETYMPGYRIPYQSVGHEASVSGKLHSVPRQILDERRKHPLLVALNEAFRTRRGAA